MPVDEIEQDCRVEAILKPDDTITLDLVHTFSLAPTFLYGAWSVKRITRSRIRNRNPALQKYQFPLDTAAMLGYG